MWLIWMTLAVFSFIHWEACIQRFYRLYAKIEQAEEGKILFKKESSLMPRSFWIKTLLSIEISFILFFSLFLYKAGYSFIYPFLFGILFILGIQFPSFLYAHQEYILITSHFFYRIAPGIPQLSTEQWRYREFCPPSLILYMIKPDYKKIANFQIEWDNENRSAHYAVDENPRKVQFTKQEWEGFWLRNR